MIREANNRPRKENFMKTEKEIKIETVKDVLEIIDKHLDGFDGIKQALNIIIKTKYGINLDRE